MKKRAKVFEINIWDFVDIGQINNELDEALKNKVYPADIVYKCIKVTKNGILTIKAWYTPEDIMG